MTCYTRQSFELKFPDQTYKLSGWPQKFVQNGADNNFSNFESLKFNKDQILASRNWKKLDFGKRLIGAL